jgi:hypothetical protein
VEKRRSGWWRLIFFLLYGFSEKEVGGGGSCAFLFGYSNHIFGLQRGFGYYFTQFAWFLMNAWGLNGSMRVESGVLCT